MKKIKCVCLSLVLLMICVGLTPAGVKTWQNAKAQEKIPNYEKYLADYYNDYSSIDFYLNEFEAPWRTYVENSPETFEAEIAAWKVGALGLEAGAEYSTAQIDFYQLLLFDVVWQEYSNTTYTDEINKNFKMLNLNVVSTVNNMWGESLADMPVTAENADRLLKSMEQNTLIGDSMKYLSSFQKYFSLCSNMEDLVERLCKVQMLLNMPEETGMILDDLSNATNDIGMRYALQKFSSICKGQLNEAEIIAMFTSEKALNVAFKESLSNMWSGVLQGSALAPVYYGQQVGKFVSNAFLGTNEIIDSWYSMQMLSDFEEVLKTKVKQYQKAYKASPTDANARKFNEACMMYMKTMNTGMDYSVRYVKAVKTGGVVNYLYTLFDQGKYENLLEKLKGIETDIDLQISFINKYTRNMYLDEYGKLSSSTVPEKEEIPISEPEYNASVEELKQKVFMVTNREINEEILLTQDMECYGDIVLTERSSVDLNGHVMTVGNMIQKGDININYGTLNVNGNLRQIGGTMDINNGALNVKGWYKLQEEEKNPLGESLYKEVDADLYMENSRDVINIEGDFVTQSDGIKRFFNGNMIIGGSFIVEKSTWNDSFQAKENHKVVLKGNKDIVVKGCDTREGIYLGQLDIENGNTRNIIFENCINIQKNIIAYYSDK